MKILNKIADFVTSRNFNLGLYAFLTGFFAENGYYYTHQGQIGWGILLSLVSIYNLANFILLLARKKVDVTIKIIESKNKSI